LVERAESSAQAANPPAPDEQAEVRFARAKLGYATAPAQARQLAAQARAELEALMNKRRAGEVAAWLREHAR
jgi:hypothetical protein